MNTQAFDQAVKMIRDGASTLAICDALERECLGLDILEIRNAVSQAATYLKELQEKAFSASIEAFERGEGRLEVEAKLRKLGFHSWDAMMIAGRAQEKAQTTDAPKPETSEADVVDPAVAQRREDESRLAALEKLANTYAFTPILDDKGQN